MNWYGEGGDGGRPGRVLQGEAMSHPLSISISTLAPRRLRNHGTRRTIFIIGLPHSNVLHTHMSVSINPPQSRPPVPSRVEIFTVESNRAVDDGSDF